MNKWTPLALCCAPAFRKRIKMKRYLVHYRKKGQETMRPYWVKTVSLADALNQAVEDLPPGAVILLIAEADYAMETCEIAPLPI